MPSDLAESLQEQGHEVTVLTGFPNYPQGKIYTGYRLRLWHKEVINGVPVVRVPLYANHGQSALKRAWNSLSFALTASLLGPFLLRRADVVHVYDLLITAALPGWWLSRLWRVPLTVEVHDMWPEALQASGMTTSKLLLRIVEGLANFVYHSATVIRVVTESFRWNLIHKGTPAAKIQVIPDWVDTNLYSPQDVDSNLSTQLELSQRFNVVFAGSIGLAQGLETVIEAAALLHDLPEVQFVLVGDGVELPNLQRLTHRRKLKNVRFLGRYPSEKMASLYALAQVLLIHLRSDPLFEMWVPHKTYAYMASGRPVLAAVRGDAAQVIEAANAGLICLPGSPSAMATAIRELYYMPVNQREALGQNGRRAACEYYSRKVVTKEVAKMLSGVVRKR